MIVRVLDDNTVVVVKLHMSEEKEQEFISKNEKDGFKLIDKLPESTTYSGYSNYKWNGTEVVVDDDANALDFQKYINENSRQYLAETDWYVTRYLETGVAVPADITILRAEAREAINESI